MGKKKGRDAESFPAKIVLDIQMHTEFFDKMQPREFFSEVARLFDKRLADRVWRGNSGLVEVTLCDMRGKRPGSGIPKIAQPALRNSQEFLILPYEGGKPVFDAKSSVSALFHLEFGAIGLSSVSILMVDEPLSAGWLRWLTDRATEPEAVFITPLKSGAVLKSTKEAERGHFG